MEAACHLALAIGTLSHRSVKSILATGRGADRDLDIAEHSFDDRLSLLLEREKTEREQRRYVRLKGLVELHLDATIEDL